jgi:hypothetical protein
MKTNVQVTLVSAVKIAANRKKNGTPVPVHDPAPPPAGGWCKFHFLNGINMFFGKNK